MLLRSSALHSCLEETATDIIKEEDGLLITLTLTLTCDHEPNSNLNLTLTQTQTLTLTLTATLTLLICCWFVSSLCVLYCVALWKKIIGYIHLTFESPLIVKGRGGEVLC